jgi:SAM-dependent methyltransferase
MTPSPFDEPELYDRIFDAFQVDVPFWKAVAVKGPVLDLGCGTGRVSLPLLESGLDVDGVDDSKPMLDRFAAKAAARGFRPGLTHARMDAFRTGRRYGTIVCAFNAFAHNFTAASQLETLRRCREHLTPGGVLVLHLSLPRPDMWLEPDDVPVLECELHDAITGTTLQLFDKRTKNRVEQTQHSDMEIRLLDKDGRQIAVYPSETDVKWSTKPELELLLRMAGFSEVRFEGGYDRRPLDKSSDELLAFATRTD